MSTNSEFVARVVGYLAFLYGRTDARRPQEESTVNNDTTDEVNTNLGVPRALWLWLDELAIHRARTSGGKKPAKKVLVREALDLLRAREART